MKQSFAYSGMAMAVLFTLAGCGGGGGGGGTPPPPAANNLPVANAGADRMVSRTTAVSLDGSTSSDADSDPLTYTWTQVRGADVTGGSGTFNGVAPSFTAPPGVQTLEFRLVVNDGKGNSTADAVVVHVLEDAANARFVDGDAGSDSTGDGSMDKPYATVRHALTQAGTSQGDIYLRTRASSASYDEAGATLFMPSGTSLYGGYGAGWNRNISAGKTELRTNALGVRYTSVVHDTWVSGLAIRAAGSSNPDDTVAGVAASGNGTARMVVEDNNIVAGSVGQGTSANPASSYGVYLYGLQFAAVQRNDITAGAGGAGAVGTPGNTGAVGDAGSNGNRTGGNRAAGGSGGPGANGGAGGARGGGLGGDGGSASAGDSVAAPRGGTIAGGNAGARGISGGSGAFDADPGNTGGAGVQGAGGNGLGALGVAFTAQRAGSGGTGGGGSGGGGGGGGAANNVGVVGGGGGGGGEGGAGGTGGQGGQGGGASVGVWLSFVATSEVVDNTIVAGAGGNGASGGSGGSGGAGGDGGSGAAGDSNVFGSGGTGASGGRGGRGGTGGRGGAGGGGPSFGVVVGPNMAPVIADNRITSGTGGAAGNGGSGGNGGEGGYSFALWDINPNDGQLPVLSGNNVLTVGNAGAGGGTSGTGGSAGEVGRSGQRNW